jgi:hypothetical protein
MKRLVVTLITIILTMAFGASVSAQKAKPLTKDQVLHLLDSAETPEQHEQLAQYFNMKATKLEAEAKEHHDLANAYHRGKVPNMGNASLCEQSAADETKAAQENHALADSHHKMAEEAQTTAPKQ